MMPSLILTSVTNKLAGSLLDRYTAELKRMHACRTCFCSSPIKWRLGVAKIFLYMHPCVTTRRRVIVSSS